LIWGQLDVGHGQSFSKLILNVNTA
jgi:hypothetical protein